MRCYCCNKPLNNYEMSLRSTTTREFLYMSTSCLKASGIAYYGNNSLKAISKTEDEYQPLNPSRAKWEEREWDDYEN